MISDEMLRAAAASSCDLYISSLEADYDQECEHSFSSDFEAKMKKLIRKAKHPYLRMTVQRVAAVFLAILLGMGVWLASNDQARAACFGWIKGMYETFFAYRYSGEKVTAADSYTKPTWIPSDYSFSFEEDTGDQFLAFYTSENRGVLSFSCIYKPGVTDAFISTENAKVSSVTVGDYAADLIQFESGETSDALVWTDGKDRFYVVSGYLTKEELLKVAESVYWPSDANESAGPGNYTLTQIPDGYELFYEEDTGARISKFYCNEPGNLLKYHYVYVPGENDVFIGAENAVITTAKVGQYTADLLLSDNPDVANTIAWTDENDNLFVVSGYFDTEELIRIAESIYQR